MVHYKFQMFFYNLKMSADQKCSKLFVLVYEVHSICNPLTSLYKTFTLHIKAKYRTTGARYDHSAYALPNSAHFCQRCTRLSNSQLTSTTYMHWKDVFMADVTILSSSNRIDFVITSHEARSCEQGGCLNMSQCQRSSISTNTLLACAGPLS